MLWLRHARKSRERIGEDSQAHVMNDEMQRKYITSIKHLMTVWDGLWKVCFC